MGPKKTRTTRVRLGWHEHKRSVDTLPRLEWHLNWRVQSSVRQTTQHTCIPYALPARHQQSKYSRNKTNTGLDHNTLLGPSTADEVYKKSNHVKSGYVQYTDSDTVAITWKAVTCSGTPTAIRLMRFTRSPITWKAVTCSSTPTAIRWQSREKRLRAVHRRYGGHHVKSGYVQQYTNSDTVAITWKAVTCSSTPTAIR